MCFPDRSTVHARGSWHNSSRDFDVMLRRPCWRYFLRVRAETPFLVSSPIMLFSTTAMNSGKPPQSSAKITTVPGGTSCSDGGSTRKGFRPRQEGSNGVRGAPRNGGGSRRRAVQSPDSKSNAEDLPQERRLLRANVAVELTETCAEILSELKARRGELLAVPRGDTDRAFALRAEIRESLLPRLLKELKFKDGSVSAAEDGEGEGAEVDGGESAPRPEDDPPPVMTVLPVRQLAFVFHLLASLDIEDGALIKPFMKQLGTHVLPAVDRAPLPPRETETVLTASARLGIIEERTLQALVKKDVMANASRDRLQFFQCISILVALGRFKLQGTPTFTAVLGAARRLIGERTEFLELRKKGDFAAAARMNDCVRVGWKVHPLSAMEAILRIGENPPQQMHRGSGSAKPIGRSPSHIVVRRLCKSLVSASHGGKEWSYRVRSSDLQYAGHIAKAMGVDVVFLFNRMAEMAVHEEGGAILDHGGSTRKQEAALFDDVTADLIKLKYVI